MLDIFRRLVKQEGPSFIIDFSSVSAGDLSAVTCKYECAKKYYTAISFYTNTWISKSPGGPVAKDGISRCSTLSDIATIIPHASIELCRSYASVDSTELLQWQLRQKSNFVQLFEQVFRNNDYGDTMQAELILSPTPAVTVKVKHGGDIVGTILVLMDGTVSVIFATDTSIHSYADHISRSITVNRNDICANSPGYVAPITL